MAAQRDDNSSDRAPDGTGVENALAIALSYDLDPAGVPKVVATGRGGIAANILAAARAAGVEVRSDPDLAALLSTLDVGQDIPTEAFVAVAELLRYVYQANGRMAELMQNQRGAEE